MEIYESNTSITVNRMNTVRTTEIQNGDQIRVGHYTATCQRVTPNGAIFLLDQYLDQDYPMNRKNANKGGYEESDLRKTLQSDEVLEIFADWREWMAPFDNGDLLRVPFFGEIFGQEDAEYFESDGCKQWPLMKDRKSRIAFRKNRWEWGWLQNKRKGSATGFAIVLPSGSADYLGTSVPYGVRPAFLIN